MNVLMSFSWKNGQGPAEFVARLTSDFIARSTQIAAIKDFEATADKVKEVVEGVVLTGLSPEAREKDGPISVVYCVYLAGAAGEKASSSYFLSEMEAAYKTEPELALSLAQALMNATLVEESAKECERLADRIGKEVLSKYPTAEIALMRAKALANATVVEESAKERERLADRIGTELLSKYPTAEIALAQAKALMNATVVEQSAKERERLADRIETELLSKYPTAEIALAQAQALVQFGARLDEEEKLVELFQRIQTLLAPFGLSWEDLTRH